jgi:hypothetical protein
MRKEIEARALDGAIYAWVATAPDGRGEGLLTLRTDKGQIMPLIGFDLEFMLSKRGIAEEQARVERTRPEGRAGKLKIRLVCWMKRITIEEL